MLWGLQVGRWALCGPKYLVGYIFIIKGKIDLGVKEKLKGEKTTFFLILEVTFSSSAPPPGWAGQFSCPYMVKPGLSWHYGKLIPGLIQCGSFTLKCHLSINYCFYVCREHILGVISLLSSLGRMWVSCHHFFIVWGHVSCFCCTVLLLSKPAFLSDH